MQENKQPEFDPKDIFKLRSVLPFPEDPSFTRYEPINMKLADIQDEHDSAEGSAESAALE